MIEALARHYVTYGEFAAIRGFPVHPRDYCMIGFCSWWMQVRPGR